METARHVDVPRQVLGRFKVNPSPPQMKTLNRIAAGMGIPLEEVCQLAGVAEVPLNPDTDVREAIRQSPDLTSSQKLMLLSMVDELVRANAITQKGDDSRTTGDLTQAV